MTSFLVFPHAALVAVVLSACQPPGESPDAGGEPPADAGTVVVDAGSGMDAGNTLGEKVALRIEHFGSTAIEVLAAKATIDILVEIPPLTDELKTEVVEEMKEIGYNFIWRTDEPPPYMIIL